MRLVDAANDLSDHGSSVEAVDEDCVITLDIELAYACPSARHVERRHAGSVNLWRDFLPPGLAEALIGKRVGDRVSLALPAGALVPQRKAELVREIARDQLDCQIAPGHIAHPDPGRFLPQGVLHRCGIGGIFRENRRPFRILQESAGTLTVDLNPPFAGYAATLDAHVLAIARKAGDRGGRSHDWCSHLVDGPGMQVRAAGQPTDFFVRNWSSRISEDDDSLFYATPRLVAHVDTRAAQTISELYADILSKGMNVLDLMSADRSHLPQRIGLATVIGLGLNGEELDHNPALSRRIVHDLNTSSRLPFPDGEFDAAVCTVSIEYLIDPIAVIRDVARTLRPEAPFVVTFSNRWFPPKALRVWIAAHPYERIGFVLECMLRSGEFGDLRSLAVRGHSRPLNDPHIAETQESDPVFAVWGRRKS